jgi:hypothetical protein
MRCDRASDVMLYIYIRCEPLDIVYRNRPAHRFNFGIVRHNQPRPFPRPVFTNRDLLSIVHRNSANPDFHLYLRYGSRLERT